MFAIAAVSQNWGIGKDNHLLFHISADMKRFRELTEGKTVLMGRKTLQSLPGGKGLPRLFLPLCERVYLTRVFADAEADAFFPDLDADPRWQVERESEIFEENGLRYQFVDYVPAEEEDDLADLLPDRSEPIPFAPVEDFTDLTGFM